MFALKLNLINLITKYLLRKITEDEFHEIYLLNVELTFRGFARNDATNGRKKFYVRNFLSLFGKKTTLLRKSA